MNLQTPGMTRIAVARKRSAISLTTLLALLAFAVFLAYPRTPNVGVAGAISPALPFADFDFEVLAPTEDTQVAASLVTLRPTSIEQSLLDHANADRAQNGLPPVELDPTLLEIARTRAADQLPLPALSHYDGAGTLAFVTLLSNAGVDYRLAGENLARSKGSADDLNLAGRIEQALMASPTHRKNILEPSFNRLAVGAATDSNGRIAFAQIFRATPEAEY